MHTSLKKLAGRTSNTFVVFCAAIVFIALYLTYDISSSQAHQSSLEQAEFEHTYGLPPGSASNYKALQKAAQNEEDEHFRTQSILKTIWLERLTQLIQEKDYSSIEKTVSELQLSELIQPYQIQVLRKLVSQILDAGDLIALRFLFSSGWPLIRCDINLVMGEVVLEHALQSRNSDMLEMLVVEDCLKERSIERNDFFDTIVQSAEPWRSEQFKALSSKPWLQAYVVKKMFELGDQAGIVGFLENGLIGKNFSIDRTPLSKYCQLNNCEMVTRKLINMGL